MKFFALCCLLAVAALAQNLPNAPGVPAAKIVPDRNAFTFTNYNLEISIEPARAGFTGRGTVTMRNDSASLQRGAALQISSSLNWAEIKVGGKPVEFKSVRIDSDIDHTG